MRNFFYFLSAALFSFGVFLFFAPTRLIAQASIQYGQIIQGAIDAGAEKDTFIFSGNSNEVISVLIGRTGGSGGFSPRIEIYNPDGSLLRIAQGGAAARIDTARLPVAGVYTVLVLDANGLYTGTYGFDIERVNPGVGSLVSYGTTTTGSIAVAGDMDSYTFNGNSSEVISVLIGRTGGSGGFSPRIEIYNPDGSLLRVAQGGAAARIDTARLPVAGVYTVLVLDANGLYTGTYGFDIERVNPGVGSLVSYGTTTTGSIAVAGDMDSYTFNGNSSEVISVLIGRTGGSGGFSPRIEIYNPDGSLLRIAQGGAAARIDTARLPVAGVYTVLVLDANGLYTGTYGFDIERVNPGVGSLVSYGTTTTGSIAVAGDMDSYTFNGNSSEVISVLIGRTGGSGGFSPRIEIYNPDGSLLRVAQGGAAARIDTARLPVTGVYTVLVLDANGLYTGTYGFDIERVNPGVGSLVSYGTTTTGSIAVAGDMDSYTFNGNSSEVISVLIGRTGGSGAFSPRIEIYNPDGSLLRVAQGGASARIDTARLPVTGVYTVLVLDANGLYTGTYGFDIERVNSGVGSLVSYGTTTTGSIAVAGDMDSYTFNGNSSEVISVLIGRTGGSGAFSPRIEIYNPDGSLLRVAQGGASARIDTARLPVTGVYTVLVLDANGLYTGSYFLTFDCFNATVNSGDWKDPSTWSRGILPTPCDSVIIMPGHTITIDTSTLIRYLNISPGSAITLSNPNAIIQIGQTGYGKAQLINNGIVNITGGKLIINGRFQLSSSSSFTMSSGEVIIDGNTGNASTSVAGGQHLFDASNTMIGFSFSGGTLQIVDPPFSSNSQAINCTYNFGVNSTLKFGDGVSTTFSNNTNGFGGNLLPAQLGKLVIDAVTATNNRVFTNLNPLVINSSLEVKSGHVVQAARLEIRQ